MVSTVFMTMLSILSKAEDEWFRLLTNRCSLVLKFCIIPNNNVPIWKGKRFLWSLGSTNKVGNMRHPVDLWYGPMNGPMMVQWWSNEYFHKCVYMQLMQLIFLLFLFYFYFFLLTRRCGTSTMASVRLVASRACARSWSSTTTPDNWNTGSWATFQTGIHLLITNSSGQKFTYIYDQSVTRPRKLVPLRLLPFV